MINLNESTLRESMSGKFLLVQFGAEWCYPCKAQKKNLGGLERTIKTESMRFGYVDTDKYPMLEEKYEGVNIPTVVLFKNGVEIGRFEGCRSGKNVQKFIGECLNT
jgi:thioredoxin 1